MKNIFTGFENPINNQSSTKAKNKNSFVNSKIRKPLSEICFWAFLKSKKKRIGIASIIILVLVLVIVSWQMFFRKPPIPARFTLEATISDTGGVSPETTFILRSSQSLSKRKIKEIVKFSPEVEFDIKKISQNSVFISSVFAAGEDSVFVFEIKPTQSLSEDEIYRVIIDNPDYADREYGWAFQIKAFFQVIQSTPRDKGTYVPTNSGIEIVFNRENLINPGDYFEISPDIEGTFEQYNDTLVFLPNQLQEKQVYTVTIKEGLKTEGSEDVLSQDYVFVFETDEKEYTGYRPEFSFYNDFLEFIPDEKPALSVYYYDLDPDNLNIDLYKFSDVNEFLSSYQNSRNWTLGWTTYYRRESGSSFQPKENQKILSFKPTIIKSGYQEFIEIPQVLESGYYLLDVNVEGRHRQAWLQITPLSHYFSVTHDKSFLWMYDFQKKEPISNSKTSFLDQAIGKVNLGETDSKGLIEFSTPNTLKQEDKDSVDPKFLKVEKDGYLPVLVKVDDSWWGYRAKAEKGDLYWDYLSTDRYVYQINDNIKYWGVVKGRQQNLRQMKVKVGIYESYYSYYYSEKEEPLISQEVLISNFDTIQGKLTFRGISPGYYTLIATIGDEVVSTANIEILSYTKPAYQITVTPSKKAIFAGEQVDFKVKASFFDGTSVSGLRLKYNGYWKESIQGELILDKNGEGVFSYIPKNYYDYPRNLEVSFSPVLSEEGEIWGTNSVLVFGPNMYLQAFQEKQSGNNYKFIAKLNHITIKDQAEDDSIYWRDEYIGEPVKSYSVSARIIKISYIKTETGQYYDPINKIVRKKYRYDKKEELVEKLHGTTDGAGEWSFTKNIPSDEATYKVIFSGQDSQGREFQDYVYPYYFYYDEKDFNASLSIGDEEYQKQFSIGDRIDLELKISGDKELASQNILFYRYQNNIDKVSIVSDLNFGESFEKELMPSAQYRAVVLGPYGFEETNTVTASFKEGDNDLTINIEPEKESYRPQEKVKINLSVKDKDNHSVSAELNVAIVDEALFHILPYNWQEDILETLYSNIYIWPMTGASQYEFLEEDMVARTGGAEMGGCFGRGTPVLMFDNSSKPIEEIKVGDKILTFAKEDNRILKSAIVQGISQHPVDDYLIINGHLEITPEHKIYVNDKWQYAGNIKIGDMLVDKNGLAQKVFSVERKKTNNTIVYNIVVGKYHTYFAKGYFVHNQEKGGTVRSEFVDVAFYQTIKTDNKGRAEISFTAPDNITSWRTTVRAFSPNDLKAGQSVKLIKTSLPFFVNATLNNYYLTGDSPIARLRVFGTDYQQNTTTKFTLKSDSLDLYKTEDSIDNFIYFPLGQLPDNENKYEFTVSAKQNSLEDSVIREIELFKNYFRTSESSIYNLSDNLSNINGNNDGFTKLTFMDTGKGKFYQALWGHTYLYGIRSDQIAASFFGEKLLAQYFNEPEPAEPLDLSDYHTPEGGISLFPYSDNDLEVSAKMADLAPEFIFENELKSYFREALRDKKADIHRISKSLYGLASLDDLVLVKINLIKEREELNLEDKIYIALALAKLGDKENARKIYQEDIRDQLHFQGQEAWFNQEEDMTKRVKMTGTAGVLASYLGISEDTDALWDYIDDHNPEKDLDLLEETLLIKSELARLKDETAEFSFETNSRKESVVLEKGRTYSLTLSSDELKTIKFNNIKGEINLASFYERSKNPEELSKNNEISLSRKYLVNNVSTNYFNEGDVVLVRLDPDILSSAIDGQYQVIDYLPSGLKPITRIYESGLSRGTDCNPVWYPSKIIDNTVYFNIYKGFNSTQYCSDRTINYYARVVSKGSYRANPAVIQSLKDLESLNISLEDRIEIK